MQIHSPRKRSEGRCLLPRRAVFVSVLLGCLFLPPAAVTSFVLPSASVQRVQRRLVVPSMHQGEKTEEFPVVEEEEDFIDRIQAPVVNSITGDGSNGGMALDDDMMAVNSTDVLLQNNEEEEENNSIIRLWNSLMTLKEEQLYARIRQLFSKIVTIIQRGTQKTEAWVRDDEVGKLVSSAVALITFFAAVAAFAVWNIELLGGKKWSGPSQGVTTPTVRLPPQSSSSAGIQFQKPKWKAPKITTSYYEESD